jgi:hypothetical protein
MSYVIAAPELMTSAATDLGDIGSTLIEEHTAAAASTVGLVPAAADEVSAGIAHLFSRYAQDYHGLAGQAAAFHERFVGHLTAGAGSYAAAEAANAALLRPLTASVGPIPLGPANFLNQLVNLFNAAVGQLTSFWNSITNPNFWNYITNAIVEGFKIVAFLIGFPIFIIFKLLTGMPIGGDPFPPPLGP